MWECDTCTRTFNSLKASEQHMNARGHWEHYCAPCKRMFNSGNNLRMVSLLFSLCSLSYLYIILADKTPPSTSTPAPIAAPMSRVPFVNEPSLPPAASHITSKTALAQTHAASTVRASSTPCDSAIETASSRTTSWNGTGRPGLPTTPGMATRTSAISAVASSLPWAT